MHSRAKTQVRSATPLALAADDLAVILEHLRRSKLIVRTGPTVAPWDAYTVQTGKTATYGKVGCPSPPRRAVGCPMGPDVEYQQVKGVEYVLLPVA